MDIADLSTPDFNLQKFVSNSQEKTEWKKASPLKTYSKKITPPSAEKADGKSRYGRVHKPRLSMDYLSTDKKVSQYLKVDVDNQMHYFKASPYAIQKPAPKTPSTPGTPRRGRPPKVSMVKPPDRVQMALHEVLDKVKAMNSSDNLNDLQAPVPTSTETIEIPTHLFIPKEEQLSDSEEVINEGDWNVGDLAWACVGGFPYWPCAVTKDPEDNKYKKLKALGKNRFQKEFIHVRFFGDKGRRSWIMTSHVIPFHGLDSFQSLAEETLTPTVKRKDPKLFRSFTIPPSLRKTWQAAVSEAESLQEAPRHERITYFLNMFPPTPPSEKKVEVKPEPKKRGRKRKTELLAVSPSPEIKKIKTEPEEEAFISPSTSNISKVFQPSTPNGLDYQPLIKVKEEPVTPTSSSIKEAKTTQITSSAVNQIKEETPSLPVKVPGKKGRPPGRRKKSDDFDFTPLKRKYTKKSSLDQRLKENRMKKRNEEKKAATKDKKFKDPAYEMFYDKTFDRVSAENPSLSDEDIEKFIEKMWHEVKDQKPIGFRSREGAEMAEMTCNDSKSDSSSRSNSPPPITVPSSKTPYKRGISLFAGIRSDKVCQVCFKNSEEGEVLKCRGPCGQPLHLHCEDKPRYQPYVFKKEPQEEAVVEKKKRGRPRSVNLTPNKSPETNCVEIKTEPKIEVVHSQDGLPFLPTILPNTNVVLSPDTPMKRKRGRPRKYPLVPSPTKVSECKYISNTQEQFISNNLNSSSQPSIVNFNSQGPENGCMPDSPSFVPDQCVNAHNKENDENYVCIGFTDEPRERYEKLLFLKRKLLLEGIFDDRSDISERTLPVLSQLKHNSRDFVDSDNNNRTVKESQKSVSKGIKSLEETKKPDNHDIMDLSLELNSSGDSVIIKDTDNINEEYSCESKNELTENFLEKNMNKEVQDSMTDISSATSEVDKEARSFKTSSNEFTSLNETDNINITEPNESANETMKMNYTESDQSVSNETNTESIIFNSSVANEYNLAETVSSEISRSIFDSTEDETNVINTSCKSDIQKTLEHIDSDEEAVLGTEAPVSEEEYLPKAETNQSIEEEVQKGESSFKQTEASNKEQIENNNVKRTDRGKDVSECSSKSDEIEDNISIENTRKSNLKLLGTLRGDSFESESSNNNLIVDDSSTDNRLEINDTAPDSQSATMDCSETKSAVLSILSGDSQTSDKITRFEDVDYGGLNKGSGVIDSNNPVTVSLDMPDLDFSENDDTIMSNPVDKKEITTKEDNCEVDNQSKSEESSSVLTSKSILLNLRDQITFAENVLNKDMALPQEKSSLCNSNVENNSASSFGDNGSLPTDKLLESCNSIQGDSRIESSAPEPRDGPVSSLDHSSVNISQTIKKLCEESPAPSIIRHQSTEESLDHSSNHSSVNISHAIKTLSEESPAPSVIRHQSTEESLDHSSVNISHTIKTLSEESPAPSLIRHQSTEESLDHSSNNSSVNISHVIKTLSEESPAPSVIRHQSTEESLDHSSINSSVNISHTIKTLSEESSAPSVIRHQSTEESLDHSSNNSSVNISHVIKTLSEESPAPSVIRHQSTEEPQSHIEEEEEEEECFEVKKEEKEVRKFSKPIRHKSVDLALGDLKSKEENGNTLKKGGDSNGEKGKNKTFLCSLCNEGKSGPCFICGKEGEERIRCGYCGKVYHLKCAKEWPQSQISETAKGRLLFHCPQHMCHTCVSDNPSACSARFNNDRLVRCVMCPATYHYGNYCVPAGSEVLSLTQLICPRHYTPQRKGLHHVNASWCFLCSMGGTLLCCDLCPNSFHADCLKISPPEGSFICEDCDTGRYPLFGEIVWVKLGTYRWWPARILFPQEVPENINQLPHSRGEFAVEFFGSHDYYWVNRGRVFLYHDGDGCKIVSKTRVDELFTRGVHEASAAFVKWTEERASREATSRISMKPPKYVKIQSNRIVGNVNKNIDSKENVAQTCECDPAKPNPCGPDSDCINRLLSVECDPEVCPAGENCCNQNFEKRNYPRLVPFKTESRGWGLKTVDAIKKGTFIIEYVGEMIDEEEYQKRLSNMVKNKDENFYFLTLDKDRMLDAGPKGNVARFMNHSCDPNCETQKWTVNGDTRVGLFALEDIKPDTELVFNYNLATVGDTKVECKCGAANCAGFIGAKNSSKPGHSRHSKLQTPTAADEKKIGMKKKKRKQSKALKLSEETCFTCGNGGELLLCDDASCPKAYHLSCLGLTKHPAGGWVCPWHQCSVCSATKVQRCTLCINSYCADHAEGNISLNRTHGLLCFSHNPSDSGSDWSDDRGNLSDEEDLAKTKQQASRKNSQSRIVNGHVD